VSSIPNAIIAEAQRQGVDPALALEVANRESGFSQNAVGAKGEVGVFQLLPSSFPGVNIWDLQTNIATGVGYLAAMLGQFNGDQTAALAAYNWGPGNVQGLQAQYGSGWFNYAPTSVRGYVAAILGNVQTQYVNNPISTVTSPLDPNTVPPSLIPPAGANLTSGFSWASVVVGLILILGLGIARREA
jgi:soluble lytic murein transglycosylase-like protein